jgi:hypothetical protein
MIQSAAAGFATDKAIVIRTASGTKETTMSDGMKTRKIKSYKCRTKQAPC